MIRKIYTEEAKKEYVRNYLLSDLSQKDFVEQHGISKSAIYNWLKLYREEIAKELGLSVVDIAKTNNQDLSKLTSEQKFRVVVETNGLDELAKGEYCRKNDLTGSEISRWKDNCMNANKESSLNEHQELLRLRKKVAELTEAVKKHQSENKELNAHIKALNKDIDRHKTALAEYAVKEIFIKKAEALLEKE